MEEEPKIDISLKDERLCTVHVSTQMYQQLCTVLQSVGSGFPSVPAELSAVEACSKDCFNPGSVPLQEEEQPDTWGRERPWTPQPVGDRPFL